MNRLYSLLIFFALALCVHVSALAQLRKTLPPGDTAVSTVEILTVPLEAAPKNEGLRPERTFGPVEQPPQFPGGTRAMIQFIQTNLRMPQRATEAGVSGRVFLSFMILETGEIKDITVLKGLGFGCDEEAVRIVGLMPKWKPGKQLDKIVRVKYNLPIVFEAKKQ